ncbi:MAG: hypothetical protein PHI81_01505 [Synergistaceae bacterium]|jgi:hypothetical protein|uniref:hypothetical protein n=1 Tax=Aminivibrio sp. TaxID=1872489 RepID=UPI0016AAF217|nr:hypothetical protein [Synergistaceae bacterium]NCC56630.1 hypothetical protein [Synergistales bacterium]MDD3391048.1 hypothetical protein [Synergistaceae bacterium]MDD3688694.1 hypothetical protein [Synergistaceae bacterium]MDD4021087.1 hypothetical protein [Synergistaceae bacterium]
MGFWSRISGIDRARDEGLRRGIDETFCHLLETVQEIRKRRLNFSFWYCACFVCVIAFLKSEGFESRSMVSQVFRGAFALSPIAFSMHLETTIHQCLRTSSPEVKKALSQPLAAARSLFDASIVIVLWKPLMETNSVERLWEIIRELVW